MFVQQGKADLLAPSWELDEPPQVFKICSHMNHSKILKLVRPIVTAYTTNKPVLTLRSNCNKCKTDFELAFQEHWENVALLITRWINLGSGLNPGWPPIEGSYIQWAIQGAWYSGITTSRGSPLKRLLAVVHYETYLRAIFPTWKMKDTKNWLCDVLVWKILPGPSLTERQAGVESQPVLCGFSSQVKWWQAFNLMISWFQITDKFRIHPSTWSVCMRDVMS